MYFGSRKQHPFKVTTSAGAGDHDKRALSKLGLKGEGTDDVQVGIGSRLSVSVTDPTFVEPLERAQVCGLRRHGDEAGSALQSWIYSSNFLPCSVRQESEREGMQLQSWPRSVLPSYLARHCP